jgi:hypothetical protein
LVCISSNSSWHTSLKPLQQIDRAVDGHFARLDEALSGSRSVSTIFRATSSALWNTGFEDSVRILLSWAWPQHRLLFRQSGIEWRAKPTESVESDAQRTLDVLPHPRFGRP